MVDQQEIRHAHMAEIHTQRVNPEMVGPFRIAHGDMAGRAMIKPKMREQPHAGWVAGMGGGGLRWTESNM